eukprot:TRINITY_DN4420_c0_g1_i1.p1 TRINITY_DN4420_c0_g1~~TRINITY_DN4420_c0_g1_i1.p1  ORF type:complete len:132 (+),score=13.09 TRINITY_DN4420_c0_g1_i1:25-420(+)
MPFDKPYMFKKNNHIVIKNASGKFLRADPNNKGDADAHGGKGNWAQWHVEKDGDHFRFKNHHTEKYLRIKANGDVDVSGGAGPASLFHAKGTGNERKLESHAMKGKYIAVRNGKVVVGAGGPFCKLEFFRD